MFWKKKRKETQTTSQSEEKNKGISLVVIELTEEFGYMTINEHRQSLGLKPRRGCDFVLVAKKFESSELSDEQRRKLVPLYKLRAEAGLIDIEIFSDEIFFVLVSK